MRPPLGFLLVDQGFALVFADATVRSLLAPQGSDDAFNAAIANFKANLEPLVNSGGQQSEFDFMGRRWRWLAFSCECLPGGPQTLHAFVLGPATGEVPYAAAVAAMFRLTTREAQALDLYMQGLPVKQVAFRLGVTESTAKTFLRSICGKMGVSGRSELMSRVLDFSCGASFNCPFRVSLAKSTETEY